MIAHHHLSWRTALSLPVVIFLCTFLLSCRLRQQGYQINQQASGGSLGQLESENDAFICQGSSCQVLTGNTSLVVQDQKLTNFRFVQYSRSNDDVRAGANPEALIIARLRANGHSNPTQELLRLTERNPLGQFRYRPELLELAKQFNLEDAGIYEVYTQTFGISSRDLSGNAGKAVRFAAILESKTNVLARAAVTGRFSFGGRVGQATIPQEGFTLAYEKQDYGTVSYALSPELHVPINSTITATLVLENDAQVWTRCQVSLNHSIDQNTEINCERFKFPPLVVIRSNTRQPVDGWRYKEADLTNSHRCVSLEQIGESGGELSADSKLAIALRTLEVSGQKTCLGCHVPKNELGLPDLFCPKVDETPFDAYGRPKEPVEVIPTIARFLQAYMGSAPPTRAHTHATVPKWESRSGYDDSFQGANAIDVMAAHFRGLVAAYCARTPIALPSRAGDRANETFTAILEQNLAQTLGAISSGPRFAFDYQTICNNFRGERP